MTDAGPYWGNSNLPTWHEPHIVLMNKDEVDAKISALTRERDELRAEIERLRAVNGEAVARLTVIVEAFDGECRLDHHGFCQEHLVTKPCEILEARSAVISSRETAMTDEPQVRFWIDHGTEVAGLSATDFRIAMRERDMLRRENERLRKALEKIANTEGDIQPSWHVQTAREALGY